MVDKCSAINSATIRFPERARTWRKFTPFNLPALSVRWFRARAGDEKKHRDWRKGWLETRKKKQLALSQGIPQQWLQVAGLPAFRGSQLGHQGSPGGTCKLVEVLGRWKTDR